MSRKNRRNRELSQNRNSPVSVPASDNQSPPISTQSKSNPTAQTEPAKVFKDEIPSAKASSLARPTLDGFYNFLSRLGLNNDNTLSDSTYVFNMVTRNRVLLEGAYRGSWIVGAIVDVVAEDMTRAGVNITTGDSVDLSILEKAQTRLQIWQSIGSGLKWGRLYGGAIGVLQIKGQDLATPLDVDTIGQGQFDGIAVFDRWMVNPSFTSCIQSGPEMGLPEYYDIVSSPINSQSVEFKPVVGNIRVHHSRVIRFIGIELPFFQAITEMMWGESVLERLWDRLISFDNATMSSAQLIDRANLRTIGVEGLREIIAAGGEARAGLEAMFEMIRFMQVNEGLTLLDKNDTFASTAYSFAGLSDMLLQFGQQLAGATGIPLVRLFGQSPQGMNSTGDGDIRMYYDNINAQQEARLRRPIDTLLKIMWRSVYGKPSPEDLEFDFTPLWQMSALDKATIAKTNTETILGASDAGLIPQSVAMQELKDISGDTGIFSNISEEDIAKADEELPPMPDEAVPGDPNAPADPNAKPDEKAPPTKDGFSEGDHPRDKEGKFTSGSGEQYSLKYSVGANGIHHVEATHSSGEHAGAAQFAETYDPETKSYFAHPVQVYVEEKYQRQGLASAIYQHLENSSKLKIQSSSKQTEAGQAFSGKRKSVQLDGFEFDSAPVIQNSWSSWWPFGKGT